MLSLNSTPAMKAAALACLIRFLRAPLPPSLPCVLNIVSRSEFSKAHEKSAQISCSSWNFPGTEALPTACSACCMWESLCVSWEEDPFSCPHCHPRSRLGVLFTATWTWSCTAKHASSFPLYLCWAKAITTKSLSAHGLLEYFRTWSFAQVTVSRQKNSNTQVLGWFVLQHVVMEFARVSPIAPLLHPGSQLILSSYFSPVMC